jgi:hypothetical protein
VEYFNGWWKHSSNKWEYRGKDWRAQYPDRIPLLGEYNNQKTMDKEIKAASDYGVDFFSILWYYPGNVKNSDKADCDDLNAGLDFFMNSRNSNKMKFMVELCNHKPFAIITDEDWDKCMDIVIKAMKHPNYLRIDGRAVLKIHSGDQFYIDNGSSIQRSKRVLQHLRQRAKDAGVGELLIMVGTYGDRPIDGNCTFPKIGGIDGTMEYMDVPEFPQKKTDYPYEELIAWAKHIRDVRKNDALSWVPYFPAGWNPRPWHDPRAAFSFPTRGQWRKGLEELKSDLLKYPNLGFPKKDGTLQKAFTIYCWNEFGEGGIVAPTQGEQYMKLEEIKKVFGK